MVFVQTWPHILAAIETRVVVGEILIELEGLVNQVGTLYNRTLAYIYHPSNLMRSAIGHASVMGDKIIILVGEDHLYLGARPGTTSVLRSSWGLRHLKLDLKLIQHYMALVANKVVCITGSSRGIGRACVLDFVKHGASALILHYLGDEETEAEIKSLQKEVKSKGAQVVTVAGDIGDPATSSMIVDAGVKAFGRIDVLVSNAGICPFAEFLTMPHATWERTRQVNLDGSFYIVQAIANVMKNQSPPGGSIIGISSISALVGGELQCHYTPTKAGILSLMQSCAIALGRYGIRANAILPGTIATHINQEDLADEKKRAYTINRTVLKRLGTPDDISGPVVFLASDLAKYVTGASLLVDGGLFVNLQ